MGSRAVSDTDPLGLWWWDGDWIELGVGGLLGFQGQDVLEEAGQAILENPLAEVGMGAAGGALAGAGTGALTGGAIGTVAAPGPGTMAGGLAGASTGFVAGGIAGGINALNEDDPIDALAEGASTGAVAGIFAGGRAACRLDYDSLDPRIPKYDPPPGQGPYTWEPPSGEADGSWRWWDADGGEWRRHDVDTWHDTPHWDYNPWTHPYDNWRNIYLEWQIDVGGWTP